MSASGSMFAEVLNGSYVLLVGNLLHHFESTDISNTVAKAWSAILQFHCCANMGFLTCPILQFDFAGWFYIDEILQKQVLNICQEWLGIYEKFMRCSLFVTGEGWAGAAAIWWWWCGRYTWLAKKLQYKYKYQLLTGKEDTVASLIFSVIWDFWMSQVFSLALLRYLLWWVVTAPVVLSSIVVAVVIVLQFHRYLFLWL